MPRDEGLPPPLRGARRRPEMNEDTPPKGDIYGRLSNLAGMGGEAETGSEEQAASLVMAAAQQLMQAAQIHPPIQEMIGRVMAVLKSGVDEIAGGGVGEMAPEGMESPEPKPKKRKRMRPPSAETEPEEEFSGAGMGY